jgi:hypothetical protein
MRIERDVRSLVSIDNGVGMVVHVAKKFCETDGVDMSWGTSPRTMADGSHTAVVVPPSRAPTRPSLPNPDLNPENRAQERDRLRQRSAALAVTAEEPEA